MEKMKRVEMSGFRRLLQRLPGSVCTIQVFEPVTPGPCALENFGELAGFYAGNGGDALRQFFADETVKISCITMQGLNEQINRSKSGPHKSHIGIGTEDRPRLLHVPRLYADEDHRIDLDAERKRAANRRYADEPLLLQPRHAEPHGPLGDVEFTRYVPKGTSPIAGQGGDDPPVQFIQWSGHSGLLYYHAQNFSCPPTLYAQIISINTLTTAVNRHIIFAFRNKKQLFLRKA
ncbi:hypothetical protein CHELA1G11_21540 [Hyphomicrobiales bacterium]|nr:hypothetical protein CHELA1G11_21540 [Hyphomicrobiales bacterium]CAH1694970.1 hypothetical protein CHELA1G2_21844 [Hyphomicrobiales bacterium]